MGAWNLRSIEDLGSIDISDLNDLDEIIIIDRLKNDLGFTFLSLHSTTFIFEIGGPEYRAVHIVEVGVEELVGNREDHLIDREVFVIRIRSQQHIEFSFIAYSRLSLVE